MKPAWIFWEEPLAGATYSNIVRLLWQNRFRVNIRYLPRLVYSFAMSTLLFPLRVTEAARFNRRIRNTSIEKDPLFIIGHYRTGTTYLITLLSKDPNRGYVSNIEAYLPHTFLAFPRLTKWIIEMSLPETRPMDDVVMGGIEPTEDEYSIGAKDKYGYYNGFIFPRNFKQYSRYNSFRECSKQDLERWRRRYHHFVQKMTLKYGGRRIMFKNPANTYRIPYLMDMYPNAKWLHLYRDPYEVFPSTVKFFREVFQIYALQTWEDEDLQTHILEDYREMYERFFTDRHLIPGENYVEVRYEDFLKDPLSTLDRVYRGLNLNGFEETRPAFQKHIDAQKSYRPNVHDVNGDVITKVNTYLSEIVESFGYEKRTAPA
ncbi:MAG: sulfotransferase [Fidelibacterota bacterium]|nr:MAG: sulfotransferase [Candidatus Neomarinimicrobiota bacterium]